LPKNTPKGDYRVIRKHFAHRIDEICDDVMKLGNTVEQALQHAVHSLQNQNSATALWVIENDADIDEARNTLEERVVMMLATQQPIYAHDLRLLAVLASITTELERIGDYASNIAQRVYNDPDHLAQIQLPDEIGQMAALTQEMLRTSLHAFTQQDEGMARSLGQTDNQVDALRHHLQDQLIEYAKNNPPYIGAAIDLIDIVRLLERAADRTTNIGERVIYILTSEIEELNE
jgi:phosphate transport system protein